MTKQQFDIFEDVMDALYGVNYSKGQDITDAGWKKIDQLVTDGYKTLGELRRELFGSENVTVTGQATTDSPKAE